MPKDNSNVKSYSLRLVAPLSFLFLLFVSGVLGYRYIENWNIVDSLYMTVITLTTIGFGEVHGLSYNGKLFTIFLALTGIATYGFTINAVLQTLLENNFRQYIKEVRMKDKISRLKDHVIVAGGGRMALAIAEQLQQTKLSFVIIEQDLEESLIAKENHLLVLRGDALEEETLLQAGIKQARGLASVLPTDADNLFVVFSARQMNSQLYIETRISSEQSRNKMLQAGANKVIFPYSLAGIQIARSFINPHIDNFMEVMLDNHDNIALAFKIHEVNKSDANCNKSISQSNFRSQGFIVVGVQNPQGKVSIAPQASITLTEGTKVFLIGENENMEEV